MGVESWQVSWWPVHRFLAAVVDQANVGPLPLAGTPSWQALADDDPTKLLALADAGQHAVLQWDIAQTAAADASKAIAAAEDWPAVARCIRRGRGAAYISRRVTA
ncbi:DUF2742 domain-containing protein [Mycolicibacter hiberniae]|uniref:Uncharacterized protein n=1 Tax=Mycolicibacter hiberniae TaxID=29314 RepID=A0A7I7X1K6_9MYCO|nr:DUF2742 domain-containing protein [Mycolicibacter hiberniae]MCV7086559.1 DUF2742 domain-containing protein [Mycolicibacter hiberniae]ORV69940.1 hypothetical protein AWC09_11035 [Mycolicibacter hiberniae]BBZ22138.1 hypothetical protein MHIB_05560 [Mycolicibacter hiberniae]